VFGDFAIDKNDLVMLRIKCALFAKIVKHCHAETCVRRKAVVSHWHASRAIERIHDWVRMECVAAQWLDLLSANSGGRIIRSAASNRF